MRNPKVLLAELAHRAAREGAFFCRKRREVGHHGYFLPGAFIERLDDKEREVLKRLKSDDLIEMFFIDRDQVLVDVGEP